MSTGLANLNTNTYVRVNFGKKKFILQARRDSVRVVFSDEQPVRGNTSFHVLSGYDAPMQIGVVDTNIWALAQTEHSSLVVTEVDLDDLGVHPRWAPAVTPFEDTLGSASMNVDGQVDGPPDLIHDGTDGVGWVGSSTGLGSVAFANAAQSNSGARSVRCWNMRDQTTVEFTDVAPINAGDYTSLNGAIRLDRFADATQDVEVGLYLEGELVGNVVALSDYVDTSTVDVWHEFTIPKGDLGLALEDIDQLQVRTVFSAGAFPRYYLDDLQLAQTGVKFKVQPEVLTQYRAIEMFLVDAFVPLLPVNGLTPIPYNALLGVSALTAGVNVLRTSGGEIQDSSDYTQFGDFLWGGWDLISSGSDGTNTWVKVRMELPGWSTLDPEHGDRVEINLTEDLTGLVDFRATLIGRELIPE